MTPAPDATTDAATDAAAPLTTEQIAELRQELAWANNAEKIADELNRQMAEANDEMFAACQEQRRENAALRDRLARAEAQIERLKRAVREAVQYTHSVPMRAFEEWQDAIAAAPTDGAARAGDAASENGDEETR